MGAAAGVNISLSKDMLAWEPVRMVTSCSSACMKADHDEMRIETMELSNADMLHDFYDSVVLFFDNAVKGHEEAAAAADEQVRRFHGALQELIVYYPSAAGVLVQNESDGRLQVRYPVPCSNISTRAAAASTDQQQADACPSRLNSSSIMKPADYNPSIMKPSRCVHDTRDENLYTHGLISSYPMYGVQFHVAHAANVTLSDLGDVSHPQPSLDLLFPAASANNILPTRQECGSNIDKGGSEPPIARSILAFQVTTFKCGSFALGQTSAHLYADGFTAATMLQNLCSIARGAGLANPPDFSQSRRAALKPRDPPSPTICYTFLGMRKRSSTADHYVHPCGTTIRFAFSMGALETLRSLASTSKPNKKCSRVQALMALLWIAYAKVKRKVHGLPSSHEMPLRFSINLRTRDCIPNLSPRYVGNALFLCSVCATLGELCESSLANVMEKIKSTVSSLDLAESLQSMMDDIELKLRDGLVPFIAGGSLGMASLVGLPFYDTDCGWGPPMYVGLPSQQRSHRCLILEHPAAHAWNVLATFASVKERTCFEESIVNYIST